MQSYKLICVNIIFLDGGWKCEEDSELNGGFNFAIWFYR